MARLYHFSTEDSEHGATRKELAQAESEGRAAGARTVALSGLERAEDIERARAAGFITQDTKPIDFD